MNRWALQLSLRHILSLALCIAVFRTCGPNHIRLAIHHHQHVEASSQKRERKLAFAGITPLVAHALMRNVISDIGALSVGAGNTEESTVVKTD